MNNVAVNEIQYEEPQYPLAWTSTILAVRSALHRPTHSQLSSTLAINKIRYVGNGTLGRFWSIIFSVIRSCRIARSPFENIAVHCCDDGEKSGCVPNNTS